MRIHYIQHVPFEGPAYIAHWAMKNNVLLSSTRVFEDSRMPHPDSFDMLVLLGGPMSVNDEAQYPWLVTEKKLVADAILQGKLVLGICLGAQMIASASGKKVYRNKQKEIGWFPVNFTKQARETMLFSGFPVSSTVFHWHGETFDLPDHAILLGNSEVTPHQGFILNDRVVGLQFHLEETFESLQNISESCCAELIPCPFIQSENFITSQHNLMRSSNLLIESLLNQFVNLFSIS